MVKNLPAMRRPEFDPWVGKIPHKSLEENMGRTLFDITHSNSILDLSPKTKDIKAQVSK